MINIHDEELDFYLDKAKEFINFIGGSEAFSTDEGDFSCSVPENFGGVIASGATKVVIIFKDKDYVIKLPLRGCREYSDFCSVNCKYSKCPYEQAEEDEEKSINYWECWECNYNLNKDEAAYSNEEEYCMAGAGLPERNFAPWDYCAAEEAIFNYAVDKKVSDCFLETKQIGYYCEVPIYIQKKATQIGYDTTIIKPSEHSIEAFSSCGGECTSIAKPFGASMIEYYGEIIFKKLCDFIKEFSVNDLHAGNHGYCDGRPILIDYSGFDN